MWIEMNLNKEELRIICNALSYLYSNLDDVNELLDMDDKDQLREEKVNNLLEYFAEHLNHVSK